MNDCKSKLYVIVPSATSLATFSSLLSASEAAGLREKSDVNRYSILADLETTRTHLIAQEKLSSQLQKELENERERTRKHSREKNAAESNYMELKAEKNKLEAMREDDRFRLLKLENELERAHQILEQQKPLLHEANAKIEFLEKSKSELSEKLQKRVMDLSVKESSGREIGFEVTLME